MENWFAGKKVVAVRDAHSHELYLDNMTICMGSVYGMKMKLPTIAVAMPGNFSPMEKNWKKYYRPGSFLKNYSFVCDDHVHVF
jgi:hypothetical protein